MPLVTQDNLATENVNLKLFMYNLWDYASRLRNEMKNLPLLFADCCIPACPAKQKNLMVDMIYSVLYDYCAPFPETPQEYFYTLALPPFDSLSLVLRIVIIIIGFERTRSLLHNMTTRESTPRQRFVQHLKLSNVTNIKVMNLPLYVYYYLYHRSFPTFLHMPLATYTFEAFGGVPLDVMEKYEQKSEHQELLTAVGKLHFIQRDEGDQMIEDCIFAYFQELSNRNYDSQTTGRMIMIAIIILTNHIYEIKGALQAKQEWFLSEVHQMRYQRMSDLAKDCYHAAFKVHPMHAWVKYNIVGVPLCVVPTLSFMYLPKVEGFNGVTITE